MKNKISLLIAALAVAGFAQVASATAFPTTAGLFIVDNATATTAYVPISGGLAGYSGSIGNWSVVITTGATISGGKNPALDLDVAATRVGTGATTLSIYYSDIGFGSSLGSYVLSTYLGTGGPVTTSAYLSTANTPFVGALLGGSADVAGALVINSTGPISAQNPYALTILEIISGSVTSMDTKLSVPDGGTTVMLLGIALSGIGLLRKKLTA